MVNGMVANCVKSNNYSEINSHSLTTVGDGAVVNREMDSIYKTWIEWWEMLSECYWALNLKSDTN